MLFCRASGALRGLGSAFSWWAHRALVSVSELPEIRQDRSCKAPEILTASSLACVSRKVMWARSGFFVLEGSTQTTCSSLNNL